MCRWIAYNGQPIFIEQLVTQPAHSLVEQSLNTTMNFKADGSIWATNGDGFGIGWYGEKDEPGVFKDERPAWNDENLHEICAQVKARLFMAHVRATTTGAVQHSNCHPFKYKNWLFQHNGHVGNFEVLRRDLQMDIAPDLYPELKGTTDSETCFLLALTYGLEEDPLGALRKMVARVKQACDDNRIDVMINLSCALSDGKALYTLRYARGEPAKTQYFSTDSACIRDLNEACEPLAENSIIVVSEPLDRLSGQWIEVPDNTFTTIHGNDAKMETFL